MRIALAAAVLAAALLTSPAASGAIKLTSSESALLRAVNATRVQHGLAPLRIDGSLTHAARYYSRRLLAIDRLEHGDFAGRLRGFDVRGAVLAENLAWGTGSYARAEAIVRAWLNSPPHRRNLLGKAFKRIGLGAARGNFAGWNGAVVVTADFAG